jgi:acetyl esterase/lipase
VQAVVDWCGPAEDFLKMDEEFLQSERGTPDHSQPDSPESLLMGRPITEIPERVREASPMHYVTQDVAPFLIQHGELDHVVPVQQSIGLAAAIERIAGPEKVTLEVLKGVYHHGDPAFETGENLDRVFAFLDQHLSKTSETSDLVFAQNRLQTIRKEEAVVTEESISELDNPQTLSKELLPWKSILDFQDMRVSQ